MLFSQPEEHELVEEKDVDLDYENEKEQVSEVEPSEEVFTNCLFVYLVNNQIKQGVGGWRGVVGEKLILTPNIPDLFSFTSVSCCRGILA